MKQYISMLRGINVGGHKNIKMEKLKQLYETLDFTNVKTYIQSGNVIFFSQNPDTSELKDKIETNIKQTFGFSVTVIIRTKSEFEQVINNNPFYKTGKEDITKLLVTFLSDTPSGSSINQIEKFKDESNKWVIAGKNIFLFCPFGYRQTKMTINFFEKNLNLSATTRNWRTVNKLYDILTKLH